MSAEIADKLAEARKLIESGWTQGAFARDKSGQHLDEFTSREAVYFCAWGAIKRACLSGKYHHTIVFFDQALGISNIAEWNDTPRRTQAEVIEAFKRAEELARADQ